MARRCIIAPVCGREAHDLDGLLASLRAAGIAVEREESMDGVGRFARVHDPEGNPVELWEPAAAA